MEPAAIVKYIVIQVYRLIGLFMAVGFGLSVAGLITTYKVFGPDEVAWCIAVATFALAAAWCYLRAGSINKRK